MKKNTMLMLLRWLIVLILIGGSWAASALAFFGVVVIFGSPSAGSVVMLLLLCLGSVVFVSVCAWLGLLAALKLFDEMQKETPDPARMGLSLQRMSAACGYAGSAWALLVTVLAVMVWEDVTLWNYGGMLLISLWLWMMALCCHLTGLRLPREKRLYLPMKPAAALLGVFGLVLGGSAWYITFTSGSFKLWGLLQGLCFGGGCILTGMQGLALLEKPAYSRLVGAAGRCFLGCGLSILLQVVVELAEGLIRGGYYGLLYGGPVAWVLIGAVMAIPLAMGLCALVLHRCIKEAKDA